MSAVDARMWQLFLPDRSAAGPGLPDGLGGEVGWWCPTISGDVSDLSGSGQNGTLVGGATIVPDTAFGGSEAVSVDGISGLVNMGDSSLYALGANGAYSVAIWIYRTDPVADLYAEYFGRDFQDTTAASGGWAFRSGGSGSRSNLWFMYRDGTFANYRLASASIVQGWQHWVFTSPDGLLSTGTLYIDGVDVSATMTGNNGINTVLADTAAGGRPDSFGGLFKGRLDDMRIINREISQAEVSKLYSQRGVIGPA